MDSKKFAIIIHNTDDNVCSNLVKSLKNLSKPKKFDVEILPVEGEGRFSAYQKAMQQSDAKYKLYLDENILLQDKNVLHKLLKIFQADEKVGIIGVSGAIDLSTNGICFKSMKRCGKILVNKDKKPLEWGNIFGITKEVTAVDGWFIATQYDLDWQYEKFLGNSFGDTAQCIEFKLKGYKVVVANQKDAWVWRNSDQYTVDNISRQVLLEEYSTDIFPLVSVIIPTFNRPEYFKLALESALNQTYRNIEVIVSDNSTNDETEQLMQDYLATDSRIKYFRHKDFTANDNWNFARHYNNPDAEYVNWLMDDDLFYPRKLEVMVDIYRNNPDVSLVTSIRDVIDADGNVTPQKMPKPDALNHTMRVSGEEAARMMFHTGQNYIGEPTTVLIRKKFLRNNDLCWTDEEDGFYSLVDISTWCQLLTQGNMVWLNDEPLSGFRRHAQQATNWAGNGAIFETSWARIFKTAWEKKFVFRDEREFRFSLINWLYSGTLRLINAFKMNYDAEEIVTLEKTMQAVLKSLRNGYKIDLPPRNYGEKTKAGRMS